jgi:hypothetical protein
MPVTQNAHQKTYSGGWADAYMTVISKDSMRRVYSTYLGGSGDEYFLDLIEVSNNRVLLVGGGNSPDFPVTSNAWQPALNDSAGYDDILIGVFSLDEMRFEELTYVGGASVDYAKSVVYDQGSNTASILLTSHSTVFPLLPPKPETAKYRGAVLNYDLNTLQPVHAIPVVDIGNTVLQKMITTSSNRTIYCGKTSRYSGSGPAPVRSTGHKTVRTGTRDVLIGELHDTPVSVRPLNEQPLPVDGIHVFPQPARDELRFVFEGAEDATVMLYDLLGRKLLEATFSGDGQVHGHLDVHGMNTGVYMLVVRTQDAVRTAKVLVSE